MIVWVLILRAVIAGSAMHIFVATFDSKSDCARFASHEEANMSGDDKLLCVSSDVKTYSPLRLRQP